MTKSGKIIYSDNVIELSLILREYYKLAYRQTQGFMESVFDLMKVKVQIPDYTTMSRRCGKLEVSLRNKLLIPRRQGQLV
ncbi:MAG: transposase, partial [Rickettsiaceae bacterium]|nr:transposase [Rickettsiaceae bacterium]